MKNTSCSAIATVPNCITALRILGTIGLLFTVPLSSIFFVVYTLCGFTDILDGWIARVTHSTSEFGARLDSIADLLFYAVAIIKLLPTLWKLLPIWIWYVVGSILLVRLASYITVAVKFRRFAAAHTRLNKVSGAAVFLLPYFLTLPCAVAYCIIVCCVSAVAAAHELVLHIKNREYHTNMNALF